MQPNNGENTPRQSTQQATPHSWVVEQVLEGALSAAEGAERLGIPVGTILRLTRERAQLNAAQAQHSPEIYETSSDKFVDNWQKAQDAAEPQPESLPPLEALVHSFPPARWLFGSERRRLATALSTCALLIGGVLIVAKVQKKADPAVPIPKAALGIPTEADADAAKEVAEAFLAAHNWQERLKFIREPESISPLMAEWYHKRGHSLLVLTDPSFAAAKGTSIGGLPFLVFELQQADGDLTALAVDVSAPEPKVDWESFVHYLPCSWDEFKRTRPTTPNFFRVRAEPSDYYVAPFNDASQFVSIRLTSPTGVVGLNGYALRQSDVGLRLRHYIEFNDRERKNLTLSLRFPENSVSPGVEVLEAIEGWIKP